MLEHSHPLPSQMSVVPKSPSSTIKAVPAFFPSLDGDPPRPPSPSSKPRPHQSQRPPQPHQAVAKPPSAGEPWTSFAERAAAARTALRMTNASANISSVPVAESAIKPAEPTPNWPIIDKPAAEDQTSTTTNHYLSLKKETHVHAVTTDAGQAPTTVRPRPLLCKQRSTGFENADANQNQPVSAPLHGSFRNDGVIVVELTTNVFVRLPS